MILRVRAQVTVFVVVSLLLVVVVVAFFFLRPAPSSEVLSGGNPRSFLHSCVEDAVFDTVRVLLDNGGLLNPRLTINYSFDPSIGQRPYSYLCHTSDFFRTCYNLQPLVEQTFESQLQVGSEESVKACFVRLKEVFENEGFSVSGSYNNYSVDIVPGQIDLDIQAEISLRKGDSVQDFDGFFVKLSSPLFWLADLTEKIVAAESSYCYFDYNAYMVLFPQFNIRRIDFDGSKIYHVVDRASDQTVKFAVRSCAFPLR